MIRSITLAAMCIGIAAPVLAEECPALIAEFEEALKTTQADTSTQAQAKALIQQARLQQAQGQPELCVDTVEQALATLSQ